VALLAFFGLAYVLPWWPSLFTSGGLFPFGPLLAAVVVTLWHWGRSPRSRAGGVDGRVLIVMLAHAAQGG